MKPDLSAPHGTSLATTSGITAVITLVAAASILGQCADLAGPSTWMASFSLLSLVLGAGALYSGRNGVGSAMDLSPADPRRARIAAARGLALFHAGMALLFLGTAFGIGFRLAVPRGGPAWLAPLAAALLALHAGSRALGWASEARRRSGDRTSVSGS
ncbi:MAG: hypothetical protein Fur0037_01680 [Planctomycetota bacterium]